MSLSGDAAREWREERDARERRRESISSFSSGYEPIEAPGREPKSSLRFTLFEDIETAPQKLYIVDGLLGEGEMSAFAGAPGSGKSVFAGDLSCHLSAGLDWLGRRVRRPLGVLYIAAERASLTKRRFAAWRKRYGVHALPLAIVEGSLDFLHNRVDVDKVLEFGERLQKTSHIPLGLIVVDTVSRALAGGDENGPKDMGAFVATVATLQAASGAHVLLIHHVPQDGNSPRLRGHGALLGAVDTLMAIEKTGETRLASVTKDNDGAEGATTAFRLESVELSIDEDGLATTAPVVVAVDGPQVAQQPRRVKPPPLPPAANVALKAFDKALAETGEPAPASNHIPTSAKVVTIDCWRTYAVQMNISSGEDRAQRQAFSRALDRLSAEGLISTWGVYAWRPNRS